MGMQMIVLILVINYAISWWNAYATGKSWAESKAIGGWIRIIAWSGAIMSAAGFSTVYLFVIAYGAYALDYIDEQTMQLAQSFGYLGLVAPLLGSGLIITMESWRRAYRDHSLLSLGVAGWNTYATIHNTMSAFTGVNDALEMIGKIYLGAVTGKGDARGKAAAVALITAALIALVALLAGALQAAVLIHKYAATDPLPGHIEAHIGSPAGDEAVAEQGQPTAQH
jgi:hypothetical protein